MNPYTRLASEGGARTPSALAARLAAWHDAMVAHERRLRTGRTGDVCDDDCPHVEAGTLWAEAVASFGERAHALSFLRSRAMSHARPAAAAVAPQAAQSKPAATERRPGREPNGLARDPRGRADIAPSRPAQPLTTEAEP